MAALFKSLLLSSYLTRFSYIYGLTLLLILIKMKSLHVCHGVIFWCSPNCFTPPCQVILEFSTCFQPFLNFLWWDKWQAFLFLGWWPSQMKYQNNDLSFACIKANPAFVSFFLFWCMLFVNPKPFLFQNDSGHESSI